eukprot:5673541-Prymnesium_polylepis.1
MRCRTVEAASCARAAPHPMLLCVWFAWGERPLAADLARARRRPLCARARLAVTRWRVETHARRTLARARGACRCRRWVRASTWRPRWHLASRTTARPPTPGRAP